ncbi:hypothetical protein [Bradyrhizobium sp. 1]|uniref:hypothetical protein n=1 Tax=Bradyrhizobium sp. 1 TaxID=241591 RepID=UPI001FFA42BD|nr:hypothetical protein [Bradyrhizobium sp. 1]MCK1396154.1 hypothetical protein [Bradyrhizobium sp. 1]
MTEAELSRRQLLRSAASASLALVAGPALAAEGNAQRTFPGADFVNSVGVCAHNGNKQTPYYSNFPKLIELLQDLGVRHIRDDALFANYVGRDHEFYQRMRTLVGMGFGLDLVCADPLNGYLFVPPRRIAEIYEWCDHGVEIFEGSNEPNLFKNSNMNPAISAEHQRTLYATVKATPALRNVVVASPSYIQKSVPIAEDISDVVDWMNIHPYPGMEHPETTGPGALLGFVAGSERIVGKKPVLVSETGYHTAVQTTKFHLPVSEPIKTRYLPRLLLWDFKNGVRRSYIYEMMDSFNNGLTDPESNFGLVTFDGTRKPCFLAVKRLLALFARPATNARVLDLRFELAGGLQDVQSIAFRRPDGSHLLFLWLGVSGWDRVAKVGRPPVSRELYLTLNPLPRAAKARVFQDDGTLSESPVGQADGHLKVVVSDQLTAVEIEA